MNSRALFTGIAAKEIYIDILSLGRRSERNAKKKLISPSRQCSITPVGFGQGVLSTEQLDNTGNSPILS
jgi:hypothetical protein